MNSITSKVCSTCDATVERKDCHKNRFAEYICRKCQAAGVKSSWHQRLRHSMKKMLRRILLGLTAAALTILLGWMFFNFLARMDS
jgi:hypothetical protein